MGTAEKGRLSEEEIERMVEEAEANAEEDKLLKKKIDARNGLEGYCYSMKNQLNDAEKGLKDKIDAESVEKIEEAISETLDWLDENSEAELEELEEKKTEIESLVNPILQQAYQDMGGEAGGAGGDFDDD